SSDLAHSYATTVSGVPSGESVTLRWTVSNGGSCPTKTSEVVLTNHALPVPTLVASDETICSGESVTFTAGGGTSYAFLVNGVVVQASSSTSTYTTTSLQHNEVVTVQVTDGNGCVATSAGIVMTVNANPVATLVSSDDDDVICAGSAVTFTAAPSGAANYNFIVNGTSIQSGTSRTFTSTSLADNSVVRVEVTTAAGCTGVSNDITLSVDTPPSAAIAGADILQCDDASFTMGATAPVTGTGTWTVISGGATITPGQTNNPSASVTLPAGGEAVLRWTVTNGVCAATFDEVLIRNYAAPSDAVAGVNQAQCNNGTFALAADVPTIGTGQWSFVGASPGATLANAHSYATTVSGVPSGESVTLRWTVSNGGSCPTKTSEVVLTNHALPVPTLVASDETICSGESVTFTAGGGTSYAFLVNG